VAQLRFSLGVATPMQIDGEPFIAPPGLYQMQQAGRLAVLLGTSAR
jgi:hypothetical protein